VDDCWSATANPLGREWWYFVLLCDDGDVLRGRLWVRGAPARGLHCGVDLTVYPVEGPPWEVRDRHDHDAFHALRDRLLVMVEASRLERRGEALHLDVRRPGVELHLEAEPEVVWAGGPVRVPQGVGRGTARDVVDRFLDGTHGYGWSVPLLRGACTGTLRRDGVARALSGTLFVDHVVADDVPTPGMLSGYRGWCWGLVYGPERTVLFVGVDHRREPVRLAFVADREGGSRLVRGRQGQPVTWSDEEPPGFVVHGSGGDVPARLTRVWHRRRAAEDLSWPQRLLALAVRSRTAVGVGTAGEAGFFFETLRLL